MNFTYKLKYELHFLKIVYKNIHANWLILYYIRGRMVRFKFDCSISMRNSECNAFSRDDLRNLCSRRRTWRVDVGFARCWLLYSPSVFFPEKIIMEHILRMIVSEVTSPQWNDNVKCIVQAFSETKGSWIISSYTLYFLVKHYQSRSILYTGEDKSWSG